MTTNHGGIAEEIAQVNVARTALERAQKAIVDDGWKIVNKKNLFKEFYFELILSGQVYAQPQEEALSLLELFNHFLPQNLLQEILDDIADSRRSWQSN